MFLLLMNIALFVVLKESGSDIRPVFPQERLLLDILLDCPLKYKNSSVWNTTGNYYYADGEKVSLTP